MNTYTFTKDHKKITFTPLKPTSPFKAKGNPQMDVLPTTLLKSRMNEFEPYKEGIFLGQELILGMASTPSLIKRLLHTFKHVFPKEIPHGLPPKRSIQHKIDLITCSTLPNKPLAYRMNLKEAQEIQRQVDDLLAKGLIC